MVVQNFFDTKTPFHKTGTKEVANDDREQERKKGEARKKERKRKKEEERKRKKKKVKERKRKKRKKEEGIGELRRDGRW